MNKAKYLNDVLTNIEAEELIKNIKTFDIDEIGSEEFIKHHTIIERLNMQAIKNALMGGDDYILECFTLHEKIKNLIVELFIISNFKTLIYPRIKNKIPEIASCKLYICLYHEAVVINLLENFFYYVTACQESEDYIIDVIEYCYNKISRLINTPKERKKLNSATNMGEKEFPLSDEMDQKFDEIEFQISMACISIIRYITDHLLQLSFPVRNHIMNVKDVPMLLVALMEIKPWNKIEKKEKNEKNSEIEEINLIYEGNQWIKSNNKLPKIEGQVWISVFNLLMNSDNNKKYEITEYRKNNILRLRKYMNEALYDQIPPLQDLYRALEEMSLIEYSALPNSNPFVVQMIPQLYNKKYEEIEIIRICVKILKEYFPSNYNSDTLKREMDMISDIYSFNNIEYFMEDPKCATCGKDATNRCSGCKTEWYCGRDCQIRRWKLHKEMCNKLKELQKELEKDADEVVVEKIGDKSVNEIMREVKKVKIEEIVEKKREFDELD